MTAAHRIAALFAAVAIFGVAFLPVVHQAAQIVA